jgi:hypothetical protein
LGVPAMSDAYNSEISGPYPSVTVDPLHRGLCISCFRCTRVTVFSFVLTTICFCFQFLLQISRLFRGLMQIVNGVWLYVDILILFGQVVLLACQPDLS